MPATRTNVPVNIQPEALTHADQLGLRSVMDQMIAHMKSIAPELRQIVVTLEHSPYDPMMHPQIVIDGRETVAVNSTPATNGVEKAKKQ